ncbi:MAG: DAK2 domain-containing protein [Chloroflexi bacterium]|nr:DAK2 domain-containing protein [Chloroflexota bacterium]
MTSGNSAGTLDGQGLLDALAGGAEWLQANVDAVNALNVYPVPDGDTGTNMMLTLQTALRDAQENPGDGSVGAMSAVIGQGALRGARGNSGVILSQYLKGFAQGLDGVGTMDGPALARGLQSASEAAYGAMSKPVEGTMLTVGREAGEAANASGSADVIDTLRAAANEADASTARTPELLPVLASAGVVDSGGQGIAVILRGALSRLTGEDTGPALEAPTIASIDPSLYAGEAGDAWGYCTEFVLMEPTSNMDTVRATMALFGESESIVEGDGLIRVHLHTSEPEVVLTEAEGMGRLEQVSIRDMDQQHQQFLAGHGEDIEDVACGVVSVASGPGFVKIMRGLGAGSIIWGGQSMNPSAEEIAEAVESIPAPDIIILPNNKNIAATAEISRDLIHTKTVTVLPTESVQQGIAALLTYTATVSVQDNMEGMQGAVEELRWAEVTFAVRSGQAGDVTYAAEQPIGLLEGDLVVSGETPESVAQSLVERIAPEGEMIVTLYYGAGITEEQAESAAEAISAVCPDDVEVEIQSGGQPLYPYLISVE